jgi:hypothetical protein
VVDCYWEVVVDFYWKGVVDCYWEGVVEVKPVIFCYIVSQFQNLFSRCSNVMAFHENFIYVSGEFPDITLKSTVKKSQ